MICESYGSYSLSAILVFWLTLVMGAELWSDMAVSTHKPQQCQLRLNSTRLVSALGRSWRLACEP